MKSKMPDNSYDQSDQQTENYHCGYRKIKTEVFFFDNNVSGQMAYPKHFIMKKIDDNSYYYNDYSCQDNVSTCFRIHGVKVAWKRQT
jgi:hypothetical protein